MRIYLSVIITLFSTTLWSKQDTAYRWMVKDKSLQPHPVIATISLGFTDYYKNDYSLPSGYYKNNTSGYTLVNTKLEYFLGPQISLAATFGYDAFIYNFSQIYSGNNGNFFRYKTDKFRLFNGGITGFYHLGRLIQIKRLDPFIGVGISLNNIRHSAYPQGDSAVVKVTHIATPYFKAGARYYISDKFSLFADVGYDRQSIFNLGFSCRFSKKHSYSRWPANNIIPAVSDTLIPVSIPVHTHNIVDSIVKNVPDKINDEPLITDSTHKVNPAYSDTVPKIKKMLLKKSMIQFGLGRSVIAWSSYPLLDTAAQKLKEAPELILRIDGYTDITGKASVNKIISQERAETVKHYLIKKGIEPRRLIAKGHGSREPIASNRTKAGRAKNRRVRITLYQKILKEY